MGKREAILMSEREGAALVVLERVRRSEITQGGRDTAVADKLRAMLAAVKAI